MCVFTTLSKDCHKLKIKKLKRYKDLEVTKERQLVRFGLRGAIDNIKLLSTLKKHFQEVIKRMIITMLETKLPATWNIKYLMF